MSSGLARALRRSDDLGEPPASPSLTTSRHLRLATDPELVSCSGGGDSVPRIGAEFFLSRSSGKKVPACGVLLHFEVGKWATTPLWALLQTGRSRRSAS